MNDPQITKKRFSKKEQEKILRILSDIRINSPESKRAERAVKKRSAEIQKVFRDAFGGEISEKTSQRINSGLAALAIKGIISW